MVEEKDILQLVKQTQNGDREAFGRLYDTYSSRLFGFVLGRVRQKEMAEDLVHTVFLKAFTAIKNFKPGKAKFSTWLFQIANYTIIDHWRTRKENVELDKVENLAELAINPKMFENYAFLKNAMKDLSADMQTILELRFWQDFSVDESAKIMNKSAVGIRVLQHRAVKILKKILKSKGLLE